MPQTSSELPPVVVLGALHHGTLGVVRSLGRLNIPVYVVEPSLPAVSSASRYCKGAFCWDLDRASPEDTCSFLLDIGHRFDGCAILIPTTDAGALFLAKNASALSAAFRFSSPPYDVVRSLSSKHQMHDLARSLGIPTPKTAFPQSKQDALDFAQTAGFPLIMKTVEIWRSRNRSSASKTIVLSLSQLQDDYDRMADLDSPNLLLQEYIPGGEESSWMFNGYFDQHSTCLFGISGRKIRQYHPYAGVTSLGECLRNPSIVETTLRFMKAIGYRGILDLGYRFDARDGTYKVFDINPRIGCTFRLFVSDNGMDVVRSLYRDLCGQPVDPGLECPGRRWMVEDLDLASSLRYWWDDRLTISQWLRSFRGLRESAFFAPDDLKPVAYVLQRDFNALLHHVYRGSKAAPAAAPPPPALPAGVLAECRRPDGGGS